VFFGVPLEAIRTHNYLTKLQELQAAARSWHGQMELVETVQGRPIVLVLLTRHAHTPVALEALSGPIGDKLSALPKQVLVVLVPDPKNLRACAKAS